jgi:hypothetical protein
MILGKKDFFDFFHHHNLLAMGFVWRTSIKVPEVEEIYRNK